MSTGRTRIIAALTVTAAVAAGAQALGGPLEGFNQDRVTHGLGAVSAVPAWNDACAAHANYTAVNGVLGHGQIPTAPGYSEAGAWAAGRSMLSMRIGSSNWDEPPSRQLKRSPFHLFNVMHPMLGRTGIGQARSAATGKTIAGFCTLIDPYLSERGVASDAVLTYPANEQQIAAGYSSAGEYPTNPAIELGLPRDTVTGPALMVYPVGPWVSQWKMPPDLSVTYPTHSDADAQTARFRIVNAQVTGPDGPVQVSWFDNSSGGGAIVPNNRNAQWAPGGFVVPLSPLREHASYQATVTLTQDAVFGLDASVWQCRTPGWSPSTRYESGCWFGARTITHSWSFRTGAVDVPAHTPPAVPSSCTGDAGLPEGSLRTDAAAAIVDGIACRTETATLRAVAADGYVKQMTVSLRAGSRSQVRMDVGLAVVRAEVSGAGWALRVGDWSAQFAAGSLSERAQARRAKAKLARALTKCKGTPARKGACERQARRVATGEIARARCAALAAAQRSACIRKSAGRQ